jgi:hypothetical protein
MNKQELITALETGRENFLELFSSLDDEEMLLQDPITGWSLKDILAHLTRWEAELVKLLWQIKQGQKPTTAHFSAIDIDQINARWLEEDRSRALSRILDDFHGVRTQTIRRVEAFVDPNLTDPNRYSFLKNNALWEWIAGDSFEHEAEHGEQVKHLVSYVKSSRQQNRSDG